MNYKKMDRNLIIMIASGAAVVLLIIIAILYFSYTSGKEYKLGKLGYKKADISIIVKKLSDSEYKKILESSYIKQLTDILKDDFYMDTNYDRYLAYASDNKDKLASDVVALVNTNNDVAFYENVEETNEDKGKLMLVNKHFGLNEKYVPSDLMTVPAAYAFQGHSLTKETYNALVPMFKAAKNAGYTLIIDTGYRSYVAQQSAYDRWLAREDEASADANVAHAGHSEHQTGLSFNVQELPSNYEDFASTGAYDWLVNNAHKYGFIIRYPEGKEAITGFKYEPSHLRFVGVDVATEVKDLNITFDEYYAFNLK